MLNKMITNLIGGSMAVSGLVWFGTLYARHFTRTATAVAVMISLIMSMVGVIILAVESEADRR